MSAEKDAARAAFQTEYERSVREYQQQRWEHLKQSQSSRDAYLSILDRNDFPKSSAMFEMPSSIILPLGLSIHLENITSTSISDRKERLELIGWNSALKDFSFGRVHKGSSNSVTSMPVLIQTSRFTKERPLIEFHTHPSSDNFFSADDIDSVLIRHSSAYISMVGTQNGGYALCTTEKFTSRGFMESKRIVKSLKENGYRPFYPEINANLLDPYGLVAYQWRNNSQQLAKGQGFHLQRMT